MTIENLDRVFEPGTVAVIGASDRPGSVGATVMHNLTSRGFGGTVVPVNPKRDSVMGLDVCRDVRELPRAWTWP